MAMFALVFALAAANPLSFPSYEQEVSAEFATPAEAQAATCAVAPLPDNAEVAFSCRWDDTNPAHLSKGQMMVRAGVKGNFYFVGKTNDPFFVRGAAELIALGHAIGNHTVSHPHMMTLGANAAFRQIADNRIRLETTIQRTVTSYVSPFGWEKDPLDPGKSPALAEALVASGHFVSQDAPMSWNRMPKGVWMWTNRFGADDRNPQRALFVSGFNRSLAAAKRSPDAPRVTLGTHSWCDEKGEADQESWLKEFFHPENSVQLNDWEYGAYRYQFCHGGVEKSGVRGCRATFRVKRFAAAYVGDAIPLSLTFSASPVAVARAGKPLVKQARGTWALPQDAVAARQPSVLRTSDGSLEVVPDEASAKLTLRFRNKTGEVLKDVYLAAALPPKWSVRRVCATCGELASGGVFERTFDMGKTVRADYTYGSAYYPASADFVRGERPVRLWAETTMPVVPMPASVPAKAASVWGPGKAAVLRDVDWAKVSLPGATLPDAANWKRPSCSDESVGTAVTAPIGVKATNKRTSPLRQLLTEGDHARYVVYDFTAEADGMRTFRCTVQPKYRQPFLYVNGVRQPAVRDGVRIPVKKGANRLVLRADARAGANYTDVLYLCVSNDG